MTTAQFQEAFKIAESDADLSQEASDCHIFMGFGLPGFKPVTVTVRQVAELIRWQARRFNGSWDPVALNEVRTIGRRRFIVVG